MIDRQCEELFPLTDLRSRTGRNKPINASTAWRWAKVGLRGIRLETTKIGGCTYTSTEAFVRFLDALDRASGIPTGAARHSAAARQADRACEVAGV